MANKKINEATVVTPTNDTLLPASNGSGEAVAVSVASMKEFCQTNTLGWEVITDKPTFSSVATTGAYGDLTGRPTIGDGTVVINQGGILRGKFSMNQKGDTVVDLDMGEGTATQSDWEQDNEEAVDFIKNKPTVPTKTSQLLNDSGFITSGSLEVESEVEEGSGKAVSGDAVYRFVMEGLIEKTFVFFNEEGEEVHYKLVRIE